MRTYLSQSLRIVALLGTIGLAACSPSPPQAVATVPSIGADRAKQLAVNHFNEKFAGMVNLRDVLTGKCSALPSISADLFTSAKLENDVWIVQREVLIGLAFTLRVAKDGSWAALEYVAFYAE